MAKTGVRRRNRDVVRSCGIYIVLEEWRTELQLFYLLNKGKG